jgi:hypothetical protein
MIIPEQVYVLLDLIDRAEYKPIAAFPVRRLDVHPQRPGKAAVVGERWTGQNSTPKAKSSPA